MFVVVLLFFIGFRVLGFSYIYVYIVTCVVIVTRVVIYVYFVTRIVHLYIYAGSLAKPCGVVF